MISTPSPPDPVATAQAQAGMNRDTAVTQQLLNMTNQYTPNGTLEYTPNGTTSYVDSQGKTIEIPRFNATTTLSEAQQRIKNQTDAASENLAGIANRQSSFLSDYLGQGVDTSGAPSMVSSAGLSRSVGGGFNSNFSNSIGGSFRDRVGDGWVTGLGPDYTTRLGPNYSATLGPDYRTNLGPGYRTNVGLTDTYAGADDFSADRARVESALWDRMAPDRAQAEAALTTRLANKGVREGSAAWDAEMARLGRQNTDARLATIAAGGQEQSRLVGLARDAASFGNDARMAGATFSNSAIMNRFNAQNAADLARQQFSNKAELDQANFQNSAELARANFTNQAMGSLFGLENSAALSQAQFGQQAQGMGNQAALQAAGFGNQAAMQEAQLANSARGQYLQEMFAQRNQPINEITALMSGAQVQNPNFVNTPNASVAGVDYAGMVQKQYEAQVANSNAAMGGLFGMGSGLFGLLGKALPFSDRRLKTDIERIGTTFGGTAIYRFRYRGEPAFHVGVMADEVPHAAVRDPSGFDRVDYGKVA